MARTSASTSGGNAVGTWASRRMASNPSWSAAAGTTLIGRCAIRGNLACTHRAPGHHWDMARVLLVLIAILALTAAPAAAQSLKASSAVGDAVSALRSGTTVYVHPDARDALSEADASQIASSIRESGGRTFVAVLPAGAGSGNVAQQIGERARINGTYVADVDRTWTAASTDLRSGQATQLIADASQGREDDAAGTLGAFVPSVADARPGQSGGGGVSGGLIAILAAVAGGGGLLAWRSQRRRKARQAAEVAELHKVARDDLDAIGEDIRLLEIDVDMPGADPRAKERYGEAVLAYTRAEEGLDLARTSAAFQPIGQALEEGRFALAAAKAHLAGRDEPERRPPCFFDPRHGPSVTDVEWEPARGATREVPVCAADAARLEAGEEPDSRHVTVGGERMPYYQAPGYYGGYYASGMFGGFGGFLPGVLFGSMIGGGWGGGASFDGSGYDGGGFGGGDFGGGDFGGGDFGG